MIQRLNYQDWPNIIRAAHNIGLNRISFLPADVTSEAFNRPDPWATSRSDDVTVPQAELPHLHAVIEAVIEQFAADFDSRFIAESPNKLRRIYTYYTALHNLAEFPPVQCNAPWVSAVVEADGTVRPCFFHPPLGHIKQVSLTKMLNAAAAVSFRERLNMETDPICRKCVCSLNLRPTVKLP